MTLAVAFIFLKDFLSYYCLLSAADLQSAKALVFSKKFERLVFVHCYNICIRSQHRLLNDGQFGFFGRDGGEIIVFLWPN